MKEKTFFFILKQKRFQHTENALLIQGNNKFSEVVGQLKLLLLPFWHVLQFHVFDNHLESIYNLKILVLPYFQISIA